MRCPCRKKSETPSYAACCQPLHLGVRPAPTAEALMRSRYTAFVMKDAAYLVRTRHFTTRPARVDFTPGLEWQMLRIIATQTDGDEATVEFAARSRTDGRIHVLHEVSRFLRVEGAWLYVDGVIKA